MNKQYIIFDQKVLIQSQDSLISSILEDELSLYPLSESGEPDVTIRYVNQIDQNGIVSSNPSIHQLTKDGFIYYMGAVIVRYYYQNNQIRTVDFTIKKAGRAIKLVRKLMNIQFTSHKEAIGQWIHEHILVPYAFTLNHLSLVHASAVHTRQGKTLLFGGTGGVGKTSLEIALCKNNHAAFVSDDICVVDNQGYVSPNLAYPKVYAYNIEGDNETRKLIFKNRSWFDILQYRLHSIRGKQFSRRRISPVQFYGSAINTRKKIDAFFVLFRCESNSVSFQKITSEKASLLNQKVISREYNLFFDHLVWSQYNSIGLEHQEFVNYEELIAKNQNVLNAGLSKDAECWMVKIPIAIDHEVFKQQMLLQLRKLDYLD